MKKLLRGLLLLLAALCLLAGGALGFALWSGAALPFFPVRPAPTQTPAAPMETPFDLAAFLAAPPPFEGEPGLILNVDRPLFTEEELRGTEGVRYSPLDALGRCGPALALLGPETLPAEERGPIGSVRPSGWQTVRYDDRIEDRYLYNRCHLIGYQLAGGNDDPENLITGTRFLNVSGMLPLENSLFAYIVRTGNHVLYRVSPVFRGEDLVASGVLMEARSLEGEGVCLCRYLFNEQPGVIIDHASGKSRPDPDYVIPLTPELSPVPVIAPGEQGKELPPDGAATPEPEADAPVPDTAEAEAPVPTYILNISSMRFHDPSCPSVEEMKEKNREDFFGTREEALALGYQPCGRCHP